MYRRGPTCSQGCSKGSRSSSSKGASPRGKGADSPAESQSQPSSRAGHRGSNAVEKSRDGDLLSHAASALRRLHFKSAGGSRSCRAVPKVVVMGSSTASETTINTSTDSANTMLTMVTTTDEQIDEVFDLVEVPPEMSSPPGGVPPTPSNSSMSASSTAIPLPSPTATPSPPTPPPPPPLPPPPSSPKHKSARRASKSKEPVENNTAGIEARSPTESPKLLLDGKPRVRSLSSASTGTTQSRYGHGGRTPPLPDLRATEFFSTPVRGSVDAGQPDADLSKSLIKLVATEEEQNGSTSGSTRSSTQSTSSRGKSVSSKKHSQKRPSVNVTTNPLDISLVETQMSGDRAARDRQSSGRSRPRAKATESHPLVSAIHSWIRLFFPFCAIGGNPAGTKRSTQATIVVQQPSLSLDGSAATILLNPDGDVRNREENMRQLLDVANTLTLQEIHDFEMRYGSPHHNRSQSVRTPGSRSSGRPNYLCLPQQRARVASMPNTGVEEEYYRLRHFSITGKVVVNRGDSLRSRRSRSNNSVASSNSSTEFLTASNPGSARNSAGSLASSRESNPSQGPAPYRVLMLGAPAVGKSSLVSQFMTSEFLHAYDTSIDDESGEKTVSVLLGGEESELTFIDHSCAEMSPESCMASYEPNAYCVVYSTTDPASLTVAENLLRTLWRSDHISDRAVILVGNKVDLVRCRLVSTEEGKSTATSFECKFIETSVAINHNVDELLVGLLTQIRLKIENPERARDIFRKRSQKNRSKSPGWSSENNSPKKYRGRRLSASLKVRTLLDRVWARDSKSKSCENLHVL